MAPSIYGHDDIKKAVACLLFGGARKVKLAAFAAPLAALHVQLMCYFSHSYAQDTLRHTSVSQAHYTCCHDSQHLSGEGLIVLIQPCWA